MRSTVIGHSVETRIDQGAFFAERDQFCQIGDAADFEAVLVIDQADIDLLSQYRLKNLSQNGSRDFQPAVPAGSETRANRSLGAASENSGWPLVEIKLDAYRWLTRSGQITDVASAPMEVSPASLASQGGGELDTKVDTGGQLRPMSTSYQARVPLTNEDRLLRVGLTGQAKAYTGWQSLGRRLARYLYRTFHFKW